MDSLDIVEEIVGCQPFEVCDFKDFLLLRTEIRFLLNLGKSLNFIEPKIKLPFYSPVPLFDYLKDIWMGIALRSSLFLMLWARSSV